MCRDISLSTIATVGIAEIQLTIKKKKLNCIIVRMTLKGYISRNDNIWDIIIMSTSHKFAIMSLHTGQKNYNEVCANYLWHSALSSIDSV